VVDHGAFVRPAEYDKKATTRFERVAKLSLMKARIGSLMLSALGLGLLFAARPANAAEIAWKGYSWSVTNGGMAGVAAGSPANVSVDANGYLHLTIQKNGSTWTAAEVFSTTQLGFGTYQWQIDGPIDTLDKNVVLGLFPYGPAAGIGDDGTNEIDIEYSRWGQASGPNGDWTNYPASGKTVGELSYTFSLSGGTLSTSRFVWTSSSIEDFLFAGLQPISSTEGLLKTWKYSPDNPKTNIPQQALPLGMNLWCYDTPSDGQNVEVVIRDFQFIPEGASGASAGGGGSGGSTPSGGSSSIGGSTASGGASPIGGSTASGGASPIGGSTASGGSSPIGGEQGQVSAGTLNAGGGGGTSSSAGATQPGAMVGQSGHGSSGASSGCSIRPAQSPTTNDLPWLFTLLALRLTRRARARTR